MRFLIDANMPRSIIALVASLGHEVEFARDVGLAAAPDPGIIVLRLSDGVIAKDMVGVTERFLRDATFVGNLAGASQLWNRIACASGLHWPESRRRIWRKRAAETHTQFAPSGS